MPVVVLTRELGAYADGVAESLSQALGCRVFGCPDVEYADKAEPPARSQLADLVEVLAQRRDLAGLRCIDQHLRIALAGNAIICSNVAAQLFGGYEGVLRVRVRATMALRVKRLALALELDDPEAALLQILAADLKSRERLQRWFGSLNPEDPALYDQVVDTGKRSPEGCALEILARLNGAAIEIDPQAHLHMTRVATRVSACLRQLRAAVATADASGESATNVYRFPNSRPAELPLNHPAARN